MKKQMHILEGIMILLILFIGFLCASKFIYHINHEIIDTSYMWNIKFTNLKIEDGSKGIINYTDDSLTVNVTLNEPKEYTIFTIDIENKGTIAACLDSYELNIDSKDNLFTYEVKYLDGSEFQKGDILNSKTKKTIYVKILYPETEKKVYDAISLQLSLNMHYVSVN